MDRDKVIELVKALDITAEELGIQPEVKPDEMFVQNVKEFIERYSSKEKAKEFFSDEYYELLGFEEDKRYKIVELKLAKTIYKNVQVILDMDELTDDAFYKGSDYADFDCELGLDYPDDEGEWQEDDCSVINADLTREDIGKYCDPELVWNYDDIDK